MHTLSKNRLKLTLYPEMWIKVWTKMVRLAWQSGAILLRCAVCCCAKTNGWLNLKLSNQSQKVNSGSILLINRQCIWLPITDTRHWRVQIPDSNSEMPPAKQRKIALMGYRSVGKFQSPKAESGSRSYFVIWLTFRFRFSPRKILVGHTIRAGTVCRLLRSNHRKQ